MTDAERAGYRQALADVERTLRDLSDDLTDEEVYTVKSLRAALDAAPAHYTPPRYDEAAVAMLDTLGAAPAAPEDIIEIDADGKPRATGPYSTLALASITSPASPGARGETLDAIRQMFNEYQQALRTLAGSYRSVAERRAAIHVRDEFEAGIEGHVGTLLAELAARDTTIETLRTQSEQLAKVATEAEQRMRELVFAWAGPDSELTRADIRDTFKVLQAAADYLRRYRAIIEAALTPPAGTEPR